MARALALAAALLSLQGCGSVLMAVLPEGSMVGAYFRIGYDGLNAASNLDNIPRPKEFRCPPVSELGQLGVTRTCAGE